MKILKTCKRILINNPRKNLQFKMKVCYKGHRLEAHANGKIKKKLNKGTYVE